MGKKKILHLLCTTTFSGAENVACQIIDMFRYDDNAEMIYCSPDGDIRHTIKEKNIKFVPLEKMSVKEVKKVIDREKPHIIHAHDMRASLIAALACKNVPLISHIHNNAKDARGLSLKSVGYIFAGFKAQKIIWVSKSSMEGYSFKNLFKDKNIVLRNIISIDELYRKMETDSNSYNYDVIYLGRLSTPKNPSRLMQVLSMIAAKKPDVKIAVVGTGDLEEITRKQAKALSLESNIHFLGFLKNPLKVLKDSKVMIMTSLWEGLPMCVLESMALGVPVVSTPTDGVVEVIDNGENGFLSDSNEELRDKCLLLIENNDLRESISTKAKARAREINDIEEYKKQLVKSYKGNEDL